MREKWQRPDEGELRDFLRSLVGADQDIESDLRNLLDLARMQGLREWPGQHDLANLREGLEGMVKRARALSMAVNAMPKNALHALGLPTLGDRLDDVEVFFDHSIKVLKQKNQTRVEDQSWLEEQTRLGKKGTGRKPEPYRRQVMELSSAILGRYQPDATKAVLNAHRKTFLKLMNAGYRKEREHARSNANSTTT